MAEANVSVVVKVIDMPEVAALYRDASALYEWVAEHEFTGISPELVVPFSNLGGSLQALDSFIAGTRLPRPNSEE